MPFIRKMVIALTTLAILLSVIAPLGVSASDSAVLNGHSSFREYKNSYSFSSTSPYSGSYYNQLSSIQKKLYDALKSITPEQSSVKMSLDEPITFTSKANLPTQAESDAALAQIAQIAVPVFFAYTWDNPLVFVYRTLSYGYDEDQIEGEKSGSGYQWTVSGITFILHLADIYKSNPQSFMDAVAAKVNAFSTTSTSRYGILKDIHNYLCENVYYSTSAKYAHEPYGALVDGNAVCEGYAEAFKLLCDKYKIPCAIIIGQGVSLSSSESHMWNAVQMENGYWYGVDVTWDDQSKIYYDFFLVGKNTVASNFGNITFGNSHVENEEYLNYPDIHSSAYVYACESGHKPEWTVLKEATYLENGQRVQKCTVCGETLATEVIPKLEIPVEVKLKETSRLKLENGYLAGIKEKVTVASLSNEFEGNLVVIGTNGKVLSSNSYVGTGCKVHIGNDLYTIYILGDVNGDGTVTPIDALRVKKIIIGTITYTSEQLKAACVSGRSKPGSMDFLRVKKHIIRTYNLYG